MFKRRDSRRSKHVTRGRRFNSAVPLFKSSKKETQGKSSKHEE
jgi:hypothetical protein